MKITRLIAVLMVMISASSIFYRCGKAKKKTAIVTVTGSVKSGKF